MKKFNFRLQKVLDIRIDKEEESKRNFRDAQLQREKVQEKLNELKDDHHKYSAWDKSKSIVEQKIKINYLNALELQINDKNDELEEKNKIVEQKREELKQKQIERKTVELLKEKQLNEYLKEQNEIEQKANDEFALYGYIRRTERG